MKRRDLIHHPELAAVTCCATAAITPFTRTPATRKVSAVPRHREAIGFVARKIPKDLEIPRPYTAADLARPRAPPPANRGGAHRAMRRSPQRLAVRFGNLFDRLPRRADNALKRRDHEDLH